jgi:biofilm PGA synthesis N-glycosyltransferase PgaC
MSVHALFWTAAALLFYTHAGYPVLLWAWAAIRARAPLDRDYVPTVSIVVVACNEAGRVESRLQNLLELDYPRMHLEIVFASDGSTDATVELARTYAPAGVRVVAFNERRGKSAVLSELVPSLRGEVVLFADARQRFDPGALRALARHFGDPDVGAVSGELMLAGGSEGDGVGFYWRYEKFIRRNESRIDSTVGVTGAIYAIRRDLFEPIPPQTILDDVLIPMQIARQGYRVTFESAALAYDRTAPADVEFRRKVRTIAGNFQLFANERWLLNPLANRLWVQTLSHKVLRLLSPLWLLIAFVANVFLLDQPFYRWLFALQVAFYAAALMRSLLKNRSRTMFVLDVPYAFCLLNWATVVGFQRLLRGRQCVTWERGFV